jgi:hypothetical protein
MKAIVMIGNGTTDYWSVSIRLITNGLSRFVEATTAEASGKVPRTHNDQTVRINVIYPKEDPHR